MSFCKDCISGVAHEGTTEGKWETFGGVESYVATPTIDYPKDKIVLLLTDAFGPQLPNSQLLADAFAKNGFKTIVPDYLNGDPIPADALGPGSKYDIRKQWSPRHGPEQSRPPLDKVIAALKEQGIVSIGATGYCFGGRYVFDLAFDNLIQVAVVTHPSVLKIPDDLHKYASASKAPLLINSCSVDQQFPPEASAQADEILGSGKFSPGYKREFFDGCTHGFAVRGDLSDPKVKAGKEEAFKAAVEWFLKHL